MMIAAEQVRQNAMTGALRSVHQTSFVYALVQALVRSTGHRAEAAMGAGRPFAAITPTRPRSTSLARV